jgi:hypothetical protein
VRPGEEGGREREREGGRERGRDRLTDRERERVTDRETKAETDKRVPSIREALHHPQAHLNRENLHISKSALWQKIQYDVDLEIQHFAVMHAFFKRHEGLVVHPKLRDFVGET